MTRSTELAVAPPTSLNTAERRLLAEALEQGESARDEMESSLLEYGRWMLVHVFEDDPEAALAERSPNPVWRALLAQAGGASLRLSARMLEVAVRVAALDRQLEDASWQALDVGRKELLLPLRDTGLLRKAAKHVAGAKLTQRDTHKYVSGLLEAQGRKRQVRITPSGYTARVRAIREKLASPAVMKHLQKVELTPAQREALADEIDQLRAWASDTLATLRRRR